MFLHGGCMKFAIGDPVLVYNIQPTIEYFEPTGNLRLLNIIKAMQSARGEIVGRDGISMYMVLLNRRPTEAIPFIEDSLRLNRWNTRVPISPRTFTFS